MTWGFLSRVSPFGVVDLNAFAEELMILESLNGLLSIVMVLELDKTKASRHLALTWDL
jgi:hypothetical protein